MQLARAAAARTLADWADPEQPPAAEPPLAQSAEPQADRDTVPHANPAAAPSRPAVYPARTASPKQTDPAVLFTRLAAVVRDCIALEARLTAAPATTPDTTARLLRADPRRAPLREAIRPSIEHHPDRADITRDIATRLDEHLAADPDQTIEPLDLLDAICEEFGIEIDFATLPDELLAAFCATTPQGENAPDPRATSPP